MVVATPGRLLDLMEEAALSLSGKTPCVFLCVFVCLSTYVRVVGRMFVCVYVITCDWKCVLVSICLCIFLNLSYFLVIFLYYITLHHSCVLFSA